MMADNANQGLTVLNGFTTLPLCELAYSGFFSMWTPNRRKRGRNDRLNSAVGQKRSVALSFRLPESGRSH